MSRSACPRFTRPTSIRLALLSLVTLIAVACSSDDASQVGLVAESKFVNADSQGGAAPTGSADAYQSQPDQFKIGTIGLNVIIEMNITMRSPDIRKSVAGIVSDAARHNGGVSSSDVTYGSGGGEQQGYASIVLKIPPTEIDAFVAGLDTRGEVLGLSQNALDVTEQLTDLDVRIRNQRQSVDSVRDFMSRTEDLVTLVQLEGELTRRQTDLERMLAEQSNLNERVAFSLVTITISTDATSVDDSDGASIGDAFRSGWDAFMSFLKGAASVVGFAAPFLVLAAIIALAARKVISRRRTPPVTQDADTNQEV